QLVVTEQHRAKEQSRAAMRLRRSALWLAGALVLALIAAIAAGSFAENNAILAAQNAAIANQEQAAAGTAQGASNRADAERATAEVAEQQAVAEAQSRATQQALAQDNFARSERERLAAEASLALDRGESGDLPALLALRSLRIAYSPEADGAL